MGKNTKFITIDPSDSKNSVVSHVKPTEFYGYSITQTVLQRSPVRRRTAPWNAENAIVVCRKWTKGLECGQPHRRRIPEQVTLEGDLRRLCGRGSLHPLLHHNRLVNMDEFLLPILKGMFKKGEPITTEDPITGEMFTEHITALMGHKEIVEKFKFFDKVVEENSQKEFKTFTKFFGRKTPSEGFREAVELRNKLLNQGLPEELLTPSVDILEEISVHNHHLHIIHGNPGYGKTIHLQQISERFVRQQRTSEQTTIPVCIKAKHLAASIREHAKEEREINRDRRTSLQTTRPGKSSPMAPQAPFTPSSRRRFS